MSDWRVTPLLDERGNDLFPGKAAFVVGQNYREGLAIVWADEGWMTLAWESDPSASSGGPTLKLVARPLVRA